VVTAGAATISVHLPQLDSWDGHRLQAHAAVSIATSEKATPAFGVVEAAWDTEVDKGARTVTLSNFRIERVRFPSATDREATYRQLLDQTIPKRVRTLELDRLEAAVEMVEMRGKGQKTQPLRNDPPKIVFSTTPAILIVIDGTPAYRRGDRDGTFYCGRATSRRSHACHAAGGEDR